MFNKFQVPVKHSLDVMFIMPGGRLSALTEHILEQTDDIDHTHGRIRAGLTSSPAIPSLTQIWDEASQLFFPVVVRLFADALITDLTGSNTCAVKMHRNPTSLASDIQHSKDESCQTACPLKLQEHHRHVCGFERCALSGESCTVNFNAAVLQRFVARAYDSRGYSAAPSDSVMDSLYSSRYYDYVFYCKVPMLSLTQSLLRDVS